MEPWGPTSLEEAAGALRAPDPRARRGRRRRVHPRDLRRPQRDPRGARAAREVEPAACPCVVQMTVDRDGRGLYGTPPEEFGARLDAWGADVIGVNCSVGPHVMLGVLERLAHGHDASRCRAAQRRHAAQVDGRTMFLCTPDYLEKSARRFLEAGARLLGGCCGTTPDHIRALAKAVKRADAPCLGATARAAAWRSQPSAPATGRRARRPSPSARALGRALAEGSRPMLVELLPPRGLRRLQGAREVPRRLKELGVTAINLPDGARASARDEPARARRAASAARSASRRCCTTAAATATCSACRPTCSAPRRSASAT